MFSRGCKLTKYFRPLQAKRLFFMDNHSSFRFLTSDEHGLSIISVSVRVHPWLYLTSDEHGLSRTFVFLRVSPWLKKATVEHGFMGSCGG